MQFWVRWKSISAVLLVPLCLAGENWDRFRGPNGSGVNESGPLPVEFGPAKAVSWKTPLPPGHSSPVFWGSRLYVTAEDGEQLYVYCLSRSTGEVLWRRAAPRLRKEKLHKLNHAASPTPAVEAGMVYAFFPDFGLIAFTHDGLEWWRAPLGPFHNVYGVGVSPILTDAELVDRCFSQGERKTRLASGAILCLERACHTDSVAAENRTTPGAGARIVPAGGI
jgi:outer membrane protein assembly factor BamB